MNKFFKLSLLSVGIVIGAVAIMFINTAYAKITADNNHYNVDNPVELSTTDSIQDQAVQPSPEPTSSDPTPTNVIIQDIVQPISSPCQK